MHNHIHHTPTQIALVKWTESVGVTLVERDLTTMRIELPNDHTLSYEILQLFPFTSERKRMGIIVRVCSNTLQCIAMSH